MKDEEWTTTWIGNTNGTATLQSWDGSGNSNSFTITNAPMLADGDKLEVSWTTSPKECLVCNETQTGYICTVCAEAVKEYRNEAFLKQIKELL